jgi:competence protein ComEC
MMFLHADATEHHSPNENSLVLRIDLPGNRILLMGDAEAGGRQDPSTSPDPHSIEGRLIACCGSAIRADVLVVGHHGSKTSSRSAFLDVVGARTFLISAGPTRYGSVTLPDAEVVRELARRGQVWRTDVDDVSCRSDRTKIGPDNDNEPGGCDNVLLRLPRSGSLAITYERVAD